MWSAATENLGDRQRMGKAIFKAILKKKCTFKSNYKK
jgi:hypothetical protein